MARPWTNVTPKGCRRRARAALAPSPHKSDTALCRDLTVTVGDFAPDIYRTDDFGKRWTADLTDGKNGTQRRA